MALHDPHEYVRMAVRGAAALAPGEGLGAPSDPGERTRAAEPAAAVWPADGPIARVLCAERDCGFGQRLQVRLERLRFAAGRLHADIVLTRAARTAREEGVAIAHASGFLRGGGLPRDDGAPDLVHRAVLRRLADIPLLDMWLDRLLAPIEGKLLGLLTHGEDWLGPVSRPVHLEPLEVPLLGALGLRVAAEDLSYDGALRGSLRLRLGTRLMCRLDARALVGPDGRFAREARRDILRGVPWTLALRRRGALRNAVDDLGAQLATLHRLLVRGPAVEADD
jgi:hypothetical protein